MEGFDLVILGAIGPIKRNLQRTLKTITSSLNARGYVLLDDGYMADESSTHYDRCLRKPDFYTRIKTAGFKIIQEVIPGKDAIEDSDKIILDSIKKRANELMMKYPEKKEIFKGYLRSQEYGNYILANEMILGTWLL